MVDGLVRPPTLAATHSDSPGPEPAEREKNKRKEMKEKVEHTWKIRRLDSSRCRLGHTPNPGRQPCRSIKVGHHKH